jgi:hypothetical protein
MFFGVPVWIIPGLLRAISAESLGTRLANPLNNNPRANARKAGFALTRKIL